MNKFLLRVVPFCLVAGMIGFSSCASKDAPKEAAKKGTEQKAPAGSLPNYRYVDLDTVLKHYNLAKDFEEEMLRMQSNMDSQLKRHESSIQGLAKTMNTKMQNNGYLSEASFKQDQEKLSNMQSNAQRDAQTLQANYQNAAIKADQTINDSIRAFIKDYNLKRGYDAIFFKGATLYINPALDITDEVVEGLNARYNKVKK